MPDTMRDEAEQALGADGLAEVTWKACDARMACCLTASPQDARGRGMLLTVERGGEPLDLSGGGVRLYLLWRHLQAHRRGCEPMEAADAAAGRFRVFWPAAMAADEGEAQCEVVVSWGGRTLASPAFAVEVGPSLVGTLSVPDGFTLFAEAIRRYEGATQEALAVAAEIRAARDAGELTGPTGPVGPQGPKGDPFTYGDFTGEQLAALTGPEGPRGETGPQGPAGSDATVTAGSVAGALTAGDGILISADGTLSAARPPLMVTFALSQDGKGVTPTATLTEVLGALAAGRRAVGLVTTRDGAAVAYLQNLSATEKMAIFEGWGESDGLDRSPRLLRILMSEGGTSQLASNHLEGCRTKASPWCGHAEGGGTEASGDYSHAEGHDTVASGNGAHAEGGNTQALRVYSHAEGNFTEVDGYYAHAEGTTTKARGEGSHAEGCVTVAGGEASHAEGFGTVADGYAKHTQGMWSPCETPKWEPNTPYAVGDVVSVRSVPYICTKGHTSGYSFMESAGWKPEGPERLGRYAHVVGNGKDRDHRSAAHTLEWDGTAWFAKAVYVGGTSGTERDDGSARLCTVDEAKELLGAGGRDGVSCTHSWDGTVLTVTSANGTSSADLRGPKGDKGDAGEQGPAGPAGATGATGPQGPRGETGETGSPLTYEDLTAEQLEALRGETGPTGPKGPQGPAGATGPQGPAGADGKDGVPCTHSWDGTVLTVTSASGTSSADLRGPKGDTGDTGPAGPQGETGPQGEAGPQGPAGADGARGPAGADGAPGKDGTDGVSCTHSWDGTVLTVTSASGTSSADLRGPKGDTGATGAEGPRGETGATGPEGPQGPKGDTGPAGPQGPAGKDGTPTDLTAYATKEWVTQQFPDLSGVSF